MKLSIAHLADASLSLPDTTFEMAGQIGRELARTKDDLISAMITGRIGPGWEMDKIKHRLGRYNEKGQPQETWCLDGRPLIEIWPAKCRTEHEEQRSMMHWTVNWRRLE